MTEAEEMKLQEQQMWDYMDEDTKDLCEKTLAELKRHIKDTELTLMCEISSDVVKEICEEEDIFVQSDILDKITTPFALAKYLRMANDLQKVVNKVKADLDNLLDKDKFDWYVPMKFDRCFSITKQSQINDESRKQALDLKYEYDEENDKMNYFLIGNPWCWPITRSQLISLLNNTEILCTKESPKNTVSSANKKDIKLDMGDIEIIVKRK